MFFVKCFGRNIVTVDRVAYIGLCLSSANIALFAFSSYLEKRGEK